MSDVEYSPSLGKPTLRILAESARRKTPGWDSTSTRGQDWFFEIALEAVPGTIRDPPFEGSDGFLFAFSAVEAALVEGTVFGAGGGCSGQWRRWGRSG